MILQRTVMKKVAYAAHKYCTNIRTVTYFKCVINQLYLMVTFSISITDSSVNINLSSKPHNKTLNKKKFCKTSC